MLLSKLQNVTGTTALGHNALALKIRAHAPSIGQMRYPHWGVCVSHSPLHPPHTRARSVYTLRPVSVEVLAPPRAPCLCTPTHSYPCAWGKESPCRSHTHASMCFGPLPPTREKEPMHAGRTRLVAPGEGRGIAVNARAGCLSNPPPHTHTHTKNEGETRARAGPEDNYPPRR